MKKLLLLIFIFFILLINVNQKVGFSVTKGMSNNCTSINVNTKDITLEANTYPLVFDQLGLLISTTDIFNNIANTFHNVFNLLIHKSKTRSSSNINKLPNDSSNTDNIGTSNQDFQKKLVEVMLDRIRFDDGAKFLDEIISSNDRLKYYDLYIKLAKERGYIVTSYIDYLEHYKNTDKKVLIIRHDIDIESPGTEMMFNIEKQEHVKATYYFRWKTFDLKLIHKIYSAGFEVGLHYETIATYCLNHNTRNIGPNEISACRKILKEEIKKFDSQTGIDMKTMASHGNPINREIHIPNNVLFIGQKYSDYGIVDETYDPNILNKYIKSYICDNDLMKNYGFAYRSNPIDSILSDDKVIEFLSHPSHWYYTKKQREQMQIEDESIDHEVEKLIIP